MGRKVLQRKREKQSKGGPIPLICLIRLSTRREEEKVSCVLSLTWVREPHSINGEKESKNSYTGGEKKPHLVL